MQRVRQLPQQLVDKVRTGLSLNSLPQAVVELLANALDAEAQNIVVRLGAAAFSFTVEDDGHGMRAEDLEVLGSRYSTSKMRSMADLNGGVQTLGFRGEAVASLFTVAAEVCITTRARGSFETLTKTARGGGSDVSTGPSAVQLTHSGTIVAAKRFLFNQPVRQRQLAAQHGDIEASTIQAVLRMALPFADVSVTLVRAPAGQVLLHLPRGRDLRALFLRLAPELPPTLPLLHLTGERGCSISALLGSLAAAYPHAQHQYLYVNRRHVLHTPLSALLNAHFLRAYLRAGYHLQQHQQQDRQRQEPGGCEDGNGAGAVSGRASRNNSSGVKAFPAFLVSIQCPYGDYDVTAEPDKSDIVFKHLPAITDLLKGLAEKAWGRDGSAGTAGGEGGPGNRAATQPAGRNSRDVGPAELLEAGGVGGSEALFEDLEQEASPTLSRALAQHAAQRRAAAAAAAALRPAAAYAPGPLQELLRLQANSSGCQMGQSKTMSLAAVAPASPVEAPDDAARARDGGARAGGSCGSAEAAAAPRTAAGLPSKPQSRNGTGNGVAADPDDGGNPRGTAAHTGAQHALPAGTQQGARPSGVEQEQSLCTQRPGKHVLEPHAGVGASLGLGSCVIDTDQDGALSFDISPIRMWGHGIGGSGSPSTCGRQQHATPAAFASRLGTGTWDGPGNAANGATMMETPGGEAAGDAASRGLQRLLMPITAGSPLPDISPGLGSMDAPAADRYHANQGLGGADPGRSIRFMPACDISPDAEDSPGAHAYTLQASAAMPSFPSPSGVPSAWSVGTEFTVSPLLTGRPGDMQMPLSPAERTMFPRRALHGDDGSPDGIEGWLSAQAAGGVRNATGRMDGLGQDARLWSMGSPSPPGRDGKEAWLASDSPADALTELQRNHNPPANHPEFRERPRLWPAVDANDLPPPDFSWDMPAGDDTPPLFKRPKPKVAERQPAAEHVEPRPALDAGAAAAVPAVGIDGFLRDLRDTPDVGAPAPRPLPMKRAAIETAAAAAAAAVWPLRASQPPVAAPAGSQRHLDLGGAKETPPLPPAAGGGEAHAALPAAPGPAPCPAAQGPPQREPVLVGVPLPPAGRADAVGDAGGTAPADDDPDESTSMSPLARFLSFTHVGSDPGEYGLPGTEPVATPGAATPEAAPLPAQLPGSAGSACPNDTPGSASGSTQARLQGHICGRKGRAELQELTPAVSTVGSSATGVPGSSRSVVVADCGARVAATPGQPTHAAPLVPSTQIAGVSPHAANGPVAVAPVTCGAGPGTVAPTSATGDGSAMPRDAVSGGQHRSLPISPTRLVQSAPPHAKKRARTVHGNPTCSLASSAQVPGVRKGVANQAAAAVFLCRPAAGGVIKPVAPDAGPVAGLASGAGGPSAAPAPMDAGTGGKDSAEDPTAGASAPQSLSSAVAPRVGFLSSGTAGAAPTRSGPQQQQIDAGPKAPGPPSEQLQRSQQPVCTFFRHVRAGASGSAPKPGPALERRQQQQPGQARTQPVQRHGLGVAGSSAPGQAAAGPGRPTSLDQTPASHRLHTRDAPGSTQQPSAGSLSTAPGSSVTGILKRRTSLGSRAEKPKRVRFSLSAEGTVAAPALVTPTSGRVSSSPDKAQQEAQPHQRPTAPLQAPVMPTSALPAPSDQPGEAPPVSNDCGPPEPRGSVLPPLLPSMAGILGDAPTAASAAGALPLLSQQQQQRGLLPDVLSQQLHEGERAVLNLERDLLRLAAPGEQLVPADVSQGQLAQADGVMEQLARKFIPAMTTGGTLLVVDQHAAHERVRLEVLTQQLSRALQAGANGGTADGGHRHSSAGVAVLAGAGDGTSVAEAAGGMAGPRPGSSVAGSKDGEALLHSQPVAAPLQLQLATHEAATLARHADVIAAWGWRLRALGGPNARGGCDYGVASDSALGGNQGADAGVAGSVWLLAGVPSVCGTVLSNPTDFRVYLHQLHETGSIALMPPAVLRVLRSKACRSAIMFGDVLTPGQSGALLAALRCTRLWAQCAHGRPTVAPLVHLPTLQAVLERRRGALRQRSGSAGGQSSVGGGRGAESGGGSRRRLNAAALRDVVTSKRVSAGTVKKPGTEGSDGG